MDLKDWLAVSEGINNIGQAMRGNEMVRQQDQQNRMYEDRNQLDRERFERQKEETDRENRLTTDEAAATEFFIRNPDKLEVDHRPQPQANTVSLAGTMAPPKAAGAPAQPSAVGPGLAQVVGENLQPSPLAKGGEQGAGDPLAGLDPEAVRRARINALEYQNKKLLSDSLVQQRIREKANYLAEQYRGALAQAAMLDRQGRKDMAMDVYVDAYNNYRPDGVKARRDAATGEIVLTDPTGGERRVQPRDISAIIQSEVVRSNPQTMSEELVRASLAGLKYNSAMAKDNVFELYNAAGRVAGYGVSGIDPETFDPVIRVYDRKPGMPGAREMGAEEAKNLYPKEQFQTAMEGKKPMVSVEQMDKILDKAFLSKDSITGVPVDANGLAKKNYAQQFALSRIDQGEDPYRAAAVAVDALRQSEKNYYAALRNFPGETQQQEIRQQFEERFGYLPPDSNK